jgi:hypothetical protein
VRDTTKRDPIAEAMEIAGCSRDDINFEVELIKRLIERPVPPTQGQYKKNAIALSYLLKKTLSVLRSMPPECIDVILSNAELFKDHIEGCDDSVAERFMADLGAQSIKRDLRVLQQCCEIEADMIEPGKRGANTDSKVYAALSAFDLLQKAGKRATLYEGGDFFKLASLLFELGTGEHGVDLRRPCEQALRSRTGK